MLTPVPEKFQFNTNYMNIPVGDFGPMGSILLKKGFTSHFEMGYQFDYLGIQGNVEHKEGNLIVLSQFYVHTFQIQYNIKKNDKIKPPFNYFLQHFVQNLVI